MAVEDSDEKQLAAFFLAASNTGASSTFAKHLGGSRSDDTLGEGDVLFWSFDKTEGS